MIFTIEINSSINNDPSADSSTEALLRLLFSLNIQVRSSFRHSLQTTRAKKLSQSDDLTPKFIDNSDGRCAQSAGT